MRYVTLAPQYMLRGWCDMKYALYNWDSWGGEPNKVVPLTPLQMKAIELITSKGVSMDDTILPKSFRNAAEKLLNRKILVECGKDEGLTEFQKYKYSDAKMSQVLVWSITGNCNLRCHHCYISADKNLYGEITFEQCKEVIRQMIDANIYEVAITGGEALVRKDFWQLIDLLIENRIKIEEIFTNGVAVTENFLDKLEERKIKMNCFMVSFDGVGCHDWLRGIKGTEEKTLAAIRLMKKRGYAVIVTTVLHNGNRNALLPTYELMKEIGVDKWKVAPIVNSGNWKQQENNSIDDRKIMEEYFKVLEKYKADGMPMAIKLGGIFYSDGAGKGYSIPFLSGCGTVEREKETLCEASRIFPHLLPDGKLIPCLPMSGTLMEKIAPNIFDEGQSIGKILTNSPIEKYTNSTYKDLFRKNAECNACEYKYKCSHCPASSMEDTGDFFGKCIGACIFIKGKYFERVQEIMSN